MLCEVLNCMFCEVFGLCPVRFLDAVSPHSVCVGSLRLLGVHRWAQNTSQTEVTGGRAMASHSISVSVDKYQSRIRLAFEVFSSFGIRLDSCCPPPLQARVPQSAPEAVNYIAS